MSIVAPAAASEYQQLHIHDSRVHKIVVSLAVCLPAAYIAVVLRFISRRIGKVPLKADDWWIVVGLVSLTCFYSFPTQRNKLTPSCKQLFTTGFVACEAVVTHLGLGRHAILIQHPSIFAKVLPAFSFSVSLAFLSPYFLSILLHLKATNHASSTVGHHCKRSLIHFSHCCDQDVNSDPIPSYLHRTCFQRVLQHESLVYRCFRSLL